jgi:ribose/xylose/arabinose/galactoside ABC-type transport system permease subunit
MINRHKLGLLFGSFLGLCHFVWAWLVLSGMAQTLTDWIFRLHFIQPPYTILPFNLGSAVSLILVTSVTGYLSGWVLGAIWNWLRADGSRHIAISPVRQGRHATGH